MKNEIDYNKRYLVQRMVQDYGDVIYVNIESFDSKQEAEEFLDNISFNDYVDTYKIKDLYFE